MKDKTPLVQFQARPVGPKCPFGNASINFELTAGGCVHLSGSSGLGKTTLATILTGLSDPKILLSTLDIDIQRCEWHPNIPERERCGVLFQQTTLLDELTVAGNLQLALSNCPSHHHSKGKETKEDKIKELLELVGLHYERDAHKRPTELSGGMGRRASLALQLAQRKRVIVLDEPFTGLDQEAAISVAKELVHLRKVQGTALLLISHEPHLAKTVMDPTQTKDNHTVTLKPPLSYAGSSSSISSFGGPTKPSLFGTTFADRFLDRLVDYTFYSLPLIGLAFVACGLAIAMLSADLMQRLDINDQVLDLVDTEVRPLIKMLTGEDANALQMMGIRFKVNSMLNKTVPPAKAKLFAIGLTKLFVLEVGPLLTALLLCGRIGGSYAGKIGTMQATAQNKLLQTLGVSPRWWTLGPSLLAAWIAGPLLTVIGTAFALGLGGWVGPARYGIGTSTQFWEDLYDSLFPVLRLRSVAPFWDAELSPAWTWKDVLSRMDLSVTYNTPDSMWKEAAIETLTYPPIYHLFKAIVFIGIILFTAEVIARWQRDLTPRGVPSVITLSVVSAGLLVILADWGFSQLWLLRQ